MTDYMIFKTRALAKAEADQMVGWDDPRPVKIEFFGWAVIVGMYPDGIKYLRSDGFVR